MFLTIKQAVKQYPILSKSTLYSAVQQGLITFYRIPSRRGTAGKIAIKEEDLLAWIESHRHEAGRGKGPPAPRVKLRHLRG